MCNQVVGGASSLHSARYTWYTPYRLEASPIHFVHRRTGGCAPLHLYTFHYLYTFGVSGVSGVKVQPKWCGGVKVSAAVGVYCKDVVRCTWCTYGASGAKVWRRSDGIFDFAEDRRFCILVYTPTVVKRCAIWELRQSLCELERSCKGGMDFCAAHHRFTSAGAYHSSHQS